MTTDVQKIFPGKEITVAGEQIQVMPIKLGQLPKAMALMLKVGTAVSSASGPEDIGVIIAEGGDELLDLIAVCVKKPRAWVDDLYPDDAAELISTFLEINKGFFVEKVLPKFPSLAQKLSNFQNQSSS